MGCLPYDITIKFWSWVVACIYIGVIGTLFINKTLKTSKEVKSQREMFRTITLFSFCFIGTRIFFLLSDFERDANCESLLYFQFVFLGYIGTVTALVNIVNFGEKYLIKKTKHSITYIILICILLDIVIVIFLPNIVNFVVVDRYGASYSQSEYSKTVIEVATVIRYFNYVIQYFSGIFILLFYLFLAVKSTGKIRTNALLTFVGLAIVTLAAALETDALLSTGAIPPFLSPTIICIGITIFSFAYLRTL